MRATLAALLLCLATSALAEVHEVQMFNRSENGPMIYEPSFLRIAPGDQVRFIPTHASRNAQTMPEWLPEGAEPFRSRINEDFTVTLTMPGTYGIKCTPHYAMGMVMIVQVGEGAPGPIPEGVPSRARERFEAILVAAE